MRSPLLALLVIAFTSCASSPHDIAWRELPKDQRSCSDKGGSWGLVTRATRLCVMPSADKGKECSDSSQCEGVCDAPQDSVIGWEGKGQCSATIGPSNYGQLMINGKAGVPFHDF